MSSSRPQGQPLEEILPHLYDPNWFSDVKSSSIWVRLYSVVQLPWGDANTAFLNAPRRFDWPQPIKVNYAHVENLDHVVFRIHIVSQEDGSAYIVPFQSRQKIVPSMYIVLSTPYIVNGERRSPAEVSRKLDALAALYKLYCGPNIMKDLILDESVHVGTGAKQAVSGIIPVLSEFDGPYTDNAIWDELSESINMLEKIRDIHRRQRLELSLELFENATRVDEKNKFFYYWVAIERVCDTYRTSVVRRRLERSYGKIASYVLNDLGLQRVINLRTQLFHEGRKPVLTAESERYIQLLYLDLFRQELGLVCRKYASEYLRNTKFRLEDLERQERRIMSLSDDGKSIIESVRE